METIVQQRGDKTTVVRCNCVLQAASSETLKEIYPRKQRISSFFYSTKYGCFHCDLLIILLKIIVVNVYCQASMSYR